MGSDGFADPAVAEAPWPPAPWHFSSVELWAGLLATDAPPSLPPGLAPLPLLGGGRRVVFYVRYRGGPLDYDELAVAVPARRGLRPGLFVEHMWVDSVPSLWAGRRIWGLPKRLARFERLLGRDGGTVEARDDGGLIARVRLERKGRGVRLPSYLPIWGGAFFGVRDARLAQAVPTLDGRFAAARVVVEEASPRFGYALAGSASWGVVTDGARATFPEPTLP